MKVVILLTLAALAASAPADKRFIVDTFQNLVHSITDIWHSATAAFKNLWNSAKAEFEKIAHGINFDAVVEKLVPLINSGMSQTACHGVCVSAAGAIGLGVAAVVVEPACNPLCHAALAFLAEKTRQGK